MPSEIVSEIKRKGGFKLNIEPSGNDAGYLRLVTVDRSDAALLAQWRTAHFDKFFTWIKPGEGDVLEWLKSYEADDRDLLFIVECPSGAAVGQMALSKIDREERSAEFGRVIRGDRRSPRDIMLNASRTLIAWAFDSLNLERIYLQVFAHNRPARRLYDELGFCLSEVQHFRRSVTPEGIERYVQSQNGTGKDEGDTSPVLKMILEKAF